eukprot:TRINITY_DN68981_c0_g1_i1.p1 TRINITY_DN68981_c0_g1~~TRINITY_DN68981_c0_g1_i1.p1  ORF type:complete len:337 (+),score=21.05 TRINITY_DN68981_c0_g1_i1:3-1013(+)
MREAHNNNFPTRSGSRSSTPHSLGSIGTNHNLPLHRHLTPPRSVSPSVVPVSRWPHPTTSPQGRFSPKPQFQQQGDKDTTNQHQLRLEAPPVPIHLAGLVDTIPTTHLPTLREKERIPLNNHHQPPLDHQHRQPSHQHWPNNRTNPTRSASPGLHQTQRSGGGYTGSHQPGGYFGSSAPRAPSPVRGHSHHAQPSHHGHGPPYGPPPHNPQPGGGRNSPFANNSNHSASPFQSRATGMANHNNHPHYHTRHPLNGPPAPASPTHSSRSSSPLHVNQQWFTQQLSPRCKSSRASSSPMSSHRDGWDSSRSSSPVLKQSRPANKRVVQHSIAQMIQSL